MAIVKFSLEKWDIPQKTPTVQWRENVFELGADIITFSNLVPTKRYF